METSIYSKELWPGSGIGKDGKYIKKTRPNRHLEVLKRQRPKKKRKHPKKPKSQSRRLFEMEDSIRFDKRKKEPKFKLPTFMTPIQFTGEQCKFLVDVLIMEKERLVLMEEKIPQLKKVYKDDLSMCNKLIKRLLLLEGRDRKLKRCEECMKLTMPKPEENIQELYTGFVDPSPNQKEDRARKKAQKEKMFLEDKE